MTQISVIASVLAALAAWIALYPLARSVVRWTLRRPVGAAEATYLESLRKDLEARNQQNRWSDRLYLPLTTELRQQTSAHEARIAFYVVRSIHRGIRESDFDSLTNAERIDSSRGVTYRSLEAAVRDAGGSAVAVIGPPGSGKTVSLRNLALKAAERRLNRRRSPLPIFVNLLYYTGNAADGSPEPFEQFLERYFSQSGYQRFLAGGRWTRILESSQGLVFLDGLDEMPRKPGDFEARSRVIDEFVQSWPTNQFVISSRERDYDGRRLSFRQILIKPFDDGQIFQYLKHYFGGSGARQVHDGLRQTRLMADLCRSPFYLDLICFFTKQRGSFPRTRAELFAYVVDEFCRREAAKKGREPLPDDARRWRDVLGGLAYEMSVRQSVSSVSLKRYVSGSPDVTPAAKQVLLDAIDGGLLEHNTESDVVRFQHHRFQEFFCADAIVGGFGQQPLPPALFTNLWWRETVLFIAGLAGRETIHDLVARVAAARSETLHGDPVIATALRTDLTILAFECVLASPEYADTATYTALRTDVFDLYRRGTTLQRTKAIDALRGDGSSETTELLAKALDDPSMWVSERAFFALSGEGLRIGVNARVVVKELWRLFTDGRIFSTFKPVFVVSRYSRTIRLLLPLLVALALVDIACFVVNAYAYWVWIEFALERLRGPWTSGRVMSLSVAIQWLFLASVWLFAQRASVHRNVLRLAPVAMASIDIVQNPNMMIPYVELALTVAATVVVVWLYVLRGGRFTYPMRYPSPISAAYVLILPFAVVHFLVGESTQLAVGPLGRLDAWVEPYANPLFSVVVFLMTAAMVYSAGSLTVWQVGAAMKLRRFNLRVASALRNPQQTDGEIVDLADGLLRQLPPIWVQRAFVQHLLTALTRAPALSPERNIRLLTTLVQRVDDLELKDALAMGLDQEWDSYRRRIAEPVAAGLGSSDALLLNIPHSDNKS